MPFGGMRAYLNINIPNLHLFLKLILILENLEDFPWGFWFLYLNNKL
jgi:hypothetical protein